MTALDIGAETKTETSLCEPSAFGPDRSLSVRDTEDVPLAPAPSSLQGKEFTLNKDGSVPVWSFAAMRFKSRLQAKSPHSPRFGARWARKTRGRLFRADECMRQWVETTALLTFTGTPYLSSSTRPMPPTSFTTALIASRSARREALRNLFGDLGGRWIVFRIMAAHQSGYPHEHVLVGTETSVDDVDFEPVVTAHRNESPIAGEGAHGAGAISAESSPNREEPTGGIRYIASDVPGIMSVLQAEESGQTSNGVVDEQEHRVRASAVVEATGSQAVRIDSSDDVERSWY